METIISSEKEYLKLNNKCINYIFKILESLRIENANTRQNKYQICTNPHFVDNYRINLNKDLSNGR